EVGDRIALARGDDVVEFTVAGFTDEAVFGSQLYQWYRLTVAAATFDRLVAEFPEARATLVQAQFADPGQAGQIALDYRSLALAGDQAALDAVASGAAAFQVADWEAFRQGRVFLANILVTIALVFAALVGVVALVMIQFRVRAHIDDSMADIGVLKALGHTSGQVAAGISLQVAAIAGVGAAAGVLLGHAALPALADALSAQSALTWRPGFDWAAAGVCVGGVVGVAVAVAALACWRLRRLPPLTALRFGLLTHDFKRDRLGLARLRLRLPWALAVKAQLRAPGQLATIALVVAAAASMATAALAAYHNIGVDKENFLRVIGGEVPDVAFEVADPADALGALADVEAAAGVRQALEYSNAVPLTIDGGPTTGLVTADFGKFEGTLLYEGRFPAHADEAAISPRHAELLGVDVGGEVRLAAAGEDARYLVTGLIQTMNEGGMVTCLTAEGLDRIWPAHPWTIVGVYLDDSAAAADFVARLERGEVLDAPLLGVMNLREQAAAQLGVYGTVMAGLAVVMLAVAAAVTTLVLVAVLGTAVRRQRSAFGVQRALGFTTGQLAVQLAATYWPAAAGGAVLGCAAGWACFPPLMGLVFRSIGIYSLSMPAPLPGTAALAAGLVVFALVVALALASGTRRATAYALVSE
ncbi:MAG: ABC transporter permease, partial [Propionibacteriaceae bacterium]|nr:ABC transporter permease [Propionibacteriaceae bacterium]